MGRVTGTVCERKLKSGTRYYAVAEYGRDGKGRRIRRWSSGFTGKKEAKSALAAMMTDEDWIPSDGSSVAALVKAYISSCADRNVEQTTILRYESVLAHCIAPFIGNVQADQLRGERLDSLYGKLLREGGKKKRPLSPTTVKYVHNLLNATYKWAMRKHRISRNPAADADPPARKKVRGRATSLTDARAIIEAMRCHRMEGPLLFAIATGMRRGEVCALRRIHLDLEAGVARVSESLANGGKDNIYVKATKTDEPREVPLSDMALEALKTARLNRAAWKLAAGEYWEESGYLFTDESGARLHPNTLTDAFRRLVAGLGLKYRLHDMRHTAATFMLRAGRDLNTVQQILGHSAASTTLNIYGHVLSGAKKDAVDTLDRMLRAAGSEG